MIQITGTKNREETLGLIAKQWKSADTGTHIEVIQPNERGGKSLEKTLKIYFPTLTSDSRKKSRYITLTKTAETPPIINEWLKHTYLQFVAETGFYSMPGLFGWDKVDRGSTLLVEYLPKLKGIGADFGCGYGYLSQKTLAQNPDIEKFYALDIDPRAIEAATKNVIDPRAEFLNADCTKQITDLNALNFVIMNPPFHDGEGEDRAIGQRFIEAAARHLKPKGQLWMVANTHMPYEKILSDTFKSFKIIVQKDGFKIIHALK